MTRYVLIRGDDDAERLVSETELPLEKNLHDVLTSHPQLVPSEDLGMGPTTVIGRESGLQSGYADLVLVDAEGHVCLVEVKKEGNPDTRRVIAQLIDYAAALWQMTAAGFEQTILQPYLRAQVGVGVEPLGLVDFATERFGEQAGSDVADDIDLAEFPARLERTLANGDFRLVVAAPSIPSGVQQAIEYLNSRGMLIYGLEVSYFAGAAECFVPRLVVKPTVVETRRADGARNPLAGEDFLEALDTRIREPLRQLLDRADDAGAVIRWNAAGPTVRTGRKPGLQLASIEPRGFAIVVKPLQGIEPEPFAQARAAAATLGGSLDKDEWRHSFRYADLDDAQLRQAFDVIVELVVALHGRIDYAELAAPLTVSFERNDNCLWAKSIPPLAGHVGMWLRGTLASATGSAPVRFEPLAGDQPGWRPPRFADPNSGAELWPLGQQHDGGYRLTVTAIGTPADPSPAG